MSDDKYADAVAAVLLSWTPKGNGETRLSFMVHVDDQKKVDMMRHMIGHDFGLAFSKIGSDSEPRPTDPKVRDGESEAKLHHSMAPVGVTPPGRNPYPGRISKRIGEGWFRSYISDGVGMTEEEALHYVYAYCKVQSRKDITPDSEAAVRWDFLESAALCWRDAPKHGVNQ